MKKKIGFLLQLEDPVRSVSRHEPKPPNTVIKMLTDIMRNKTTAATMSSNDVKVLIEVINRSLLNESTDFVVIKMGQ